MADNAGSVAGIDMNPLIRAGNRVVAVDALIARKPASNREAVGRIRRGRQRDRGGWPHRGRAR